MADAEVPSFSDEPFVDDSTCPPWRGKGASQTVAAANEPGLGRDALEIRALQLANGAGRGSRRGAKGGAASTADAAFCIRPTMQASADEWYSLVLLVRGRSEASRLHGGCNARGS